MGFMDSIKNLAGDAKLLTSLKEVLDGQGGIEGLTQKLKANGLDVAQSITPEQIKSVLGAPAIQGLVSKTGFTPEEISTKLAAILPTAISKLQSLSR